MENPLGLDNGWIQTHSGKKFTPLCPVVSDIDIEDIAWSLSMQCRYNGHTNGFYSVAEHSVFVSRKVHPDYALWGLLHDATEAYLSDIPAPLKRLPEFAFYKDAEAQMMLAICERFGLPTIEPDDVKRVDRAVLVTEAAILMRPLHPEWVFKEPEYKGYTDAVKCLDPEKARELFLSEFRQLYRGK